MRHAYSPDQTNVREWFVTFSAIALLLGFLPPSEAFAQSPSWRDSVTIAKVDVVFRRDAVLVVTDLLFGPTPQETDVSARKLFVSYGGPSVPRAFEATAIALAPGYFDPPTNATGSAVTVEPALSAPDATDLVVGRGSLAGSALTLSNELIATVTQPTGSGVLRLKAVHALQNVGDDRLVLARIATNRPSALALGKVAVRSEQVSLVSKFARFCSAKGDGQNLLLAGEKPSANLLAPFRATRSVSDDLCVGATLQPR